MDRAKPHRIIVNVLALAALLAFYNFGFGADGQFDNLLEQATGAEVRGEVPKAIKLYEQASLVQSNNAADLCALSKGYCNLTYLTDSAAVQRDALKRAVNCAEQAVRIGPNNATAHASLAVCYARSCAFADIKTQLAYSRLFKQEAEKAIALDSKQDIAFYLLGRWNYEIARVGFFSRAYVKLVYGGLPKASYQEAISDFQKAVSLAPDRIIHHEGLAMAYQATGEKDLAIKELEKCRALKPSDIADRESQREALKRLEALNR